jgi:hypothetical protein
MLAMTAMAVTVMWKFFIEIGFVVSEMRHDGGVITSPLPS